MDGYRAFVTAFARLWVMAVVGSLPALASAQGVSVEAGTSGTPEFAAIPDIVLARMAENPTAGIVRIPFLNSTLIGVGPAEEVANVTAIAPIVPILFENHWSLLTRTAIPLLLSFPIGGERVNGFGDIGLELFGHKQLRGRDRFYDIIFGPSFVFPSASDDRLGAGRYQVGAEVGFSYSGRQWVSVLIAENVWSVGDDNGRADVNRLGLEFLLFYNLPKLFYIAYEPVITANWEAPQGQRWTFPIGLGFGRHHRLPRRDRLGLTTRVSALYNVVRPDNAAAWQVIGTVVLWQPNASLFSD